MAHQYAKIAFTASVRQMQEKQGSRAGYAGMDTGVDYNYLLSEDERRFIESRDSFYMASVSETSWPYVQHRGGPAGFLKVIDEKTLGFADYSGNRQYISSGNFRTNDKVSLMLMDYANRRRLKIIGHISQVDESNWEQLASLEDDHYRARVERGFIINIVAFDWNCPQHITPRYNESELAELIAPLQEKIASLNEKANRNSTTSLEKLGDGDLPLVVAGIRQLTPQIRAYELRSPGAETLPTISAGSHIQVPILDFDGKPSWRTYSISSNPNRTDCYEIAVKLEEQGQGGSVAVHQQYQLGLLLHCKQPQNHFALNEEVQHHVLIAGGIGITPIKSMAIALDKQQKSFELHYAGRSEKEMAYTDRLVWQFGEKVHLYPSLSKQKLSIRNLLSKLDLSRKASTQIYFCGPTSILEELKMIMQEFGIPDDKLHFEQFSAALNASAKNCELILNRSKQSLAVGSNQSLLDAVLDAGIDIPFSCKTGQCKSCVVKISSSEKVQHFDQCLSENERASGHMCLCVSRPLTGSLTIEL